jgi:hypothetical protein
MPRCSQLVLQPCPKVRMADCNERLAALAQGQAVEVHGAILRDNPVDMAPGRHDAGSGRQLKDNSRELAAAGRRGSAYLPATGPRRA